MQSWDVWRAAEMRDERPRCVTWCRGVWREAERWHCARKRRPKGKWERERERECVCVCVIKWPKAKCEVRLVTKSMWPEVWREDCDKSEVKAKCEANSEKQSEKKWWTFSNTVLSHRWGKQWKRQAEAKPDCRLYWEEMKFEVHEFWELDSSFGRVITEVFIVKRVTYENVWNKANTKRIINGDKKNNKKKHDNKRI